MKIVEIMNEVELLETGIKGSYKSFTRMSEADALRINIGCGNDFAVNQYIIDGRQAEMGDEGIFKINGRYYTGWEV